MGMGKDEGVLLAGNASSSGMVGNEARRWTGCKRSSSSSSLADQGSEKRQKVLHGDSAAAGSEMRRCCSVEDISNIMDGSNRGPVKRLSDISVVDNGKETHAGSSLPSPGNRVQAAMPVTARMGSCGFDLFPPYSSAVTPLAKAASNVMAETAMCRFIASPDSAVMSHDDGVPSGTAPLVPNGWQESGGLLPADAALLDETPGRGSSIACGGSGTGTGNGCQVSSISSHVNEMTMEAMGWSRPMAADVDCPPRQLSPELDQAVVLRDAELASDVVVASVELAGPSAAAQASLGDAQLGKEFPTLVLSPGAGPGCPLTFPSPVLGAQDECSSDSSLAGMGTPVPAGFCLDQPLSSPACPGAPLKPRRHLSCRERAVRRLDNGEVKKCLFNPTC